MENNVPEVDEVIKTIEFIPEGEYSEVLASFDFGDFMGEEKEDVPDDEGIEDDVMASSQLQSGCRGPGGTNNEWLEEVQRPEIDLMNKEELACFVRSAKNTNTVKKTVQVVTAFKGWLKNFCLEVTAIEEIPPGELDGFISNYLLAQKKKNGEEHQPDTLTGIHQATLRYLKERDYPVDPLQDPAFEMSREVLSSKRIKLKQMGLGNRPNRSECFDEDQIEKLWSSGALGSGDPKILQGTVYYTLNIGFGLRGCHEARQMAWGDGDLKMDDHMTPYLEFNERVSKTRQGGQGQEVRSFPPKVYATGDERCPIWHYKPFAGKRPLVALADEAPFYLTVHPNSTMEDEYCYIMAPMGVNKLGQIVKDMCTMAAIKGRHTSHSLRKTTCQRLMAADVPPLMVAQQVATSA